MEISHAYVFYNFPNDVAQFFNNYREENPTSFIV